MVKPIEARSFKSFFWMALAAAFGGFMVAIPGILIGAQLVAENSLGGFEDLVGAIMGMVVGFPLGAVLGFSSSAGCSNTGGRCGWQRSGLRPGFCSSSAWPNR